MNTPINSNQTKQIDDESDLAVAMVFPSLSKAMASFGGDGTSAIVNAFTLQVVSLDNNNRITTVNVKSIIRIV